MSFLGNIVNNVLSPGVALTIALLANDVSAGNAAMRALVICTKGSAGTITAGTQVAKGVTGADAAKVLVGPGVPGHLAVKRIFEENPLGQVDIVASADAIGNAATATLVFDDTVAVTIGQTLSVTIAGRLAQFQWTVGLTKVQAATAFVARMLNFDADLPVTFANGGGTLATVTMTHKIKGVGGNDVKISSTFTGGAGGTVTLSGNLGSVATGTTEPDFATCLLQVVTTQYDLILLVTSNADAASASGTANTAVLKAHISGHNTGFGALLQQAVYAHTGALSAAKTGTAAIDFGPMECVYARGLLSLPCELAGAELGARLREEQLDPNVNRCNRFDAPYRATLYVSPTLSSDALQPNEREDALQSGLSSVSYTATGTPYIDIPRTTYFLDGLGAIDLRLVYCSQVSSLYAIGKDIRTWLPVRFPGAKILRALPRDRQKLPDKVVDVAGVKAAVVDRIRTVWCPKGVADEAALDDSIDNGEFLVDVDPGNSSKVNFQLPVRIVPPWTISDITLMQRTRAA